MKKFNENENEEEPNDTRYSLDFQKKEKDGNHIMFQSQSFLKENRPLSAKPLLFRKYIPKLKPVQSHVNPSFMYLGGSKDNSKSKKYKENLLNNKNNINIVAEEDYEKTANSGDERYSFNNLNSNKNMPFSSSDDNEITVNDNINIINTNDINKIEENFNIDIKATKTKSKKGVRNNFNHIRKIFIKYKDKIPNKKYIDDTDIVTNTQYKDYIQKNYSSKWDEYYFDCDFVQKRKSKSIYEGKNKNQNRPPILGFLQMNENSANTSLSSALSEK